MDCVGAWSECNAACEKTYTATTVHSGQGVPCDAPTGTVDACSPGEGACPATSCLGSWSSCDEDCTDKVFTVTQEPSGGGIPCIAAHNDVLACEPGEDLCPLNTDCVGSWSDCDRFCVRTFAVSTAVSGQGSVCEAADGALEGCAGGVDDCPEDINCLGTWTQCAPDCSDSMHTIVREVSGNGAECGYIDGETRPCSPGDGACPADIDCVGEWTLCDAACSSMFVVYTEASGNGAGCTAAAGDTMSCAATSPCDDGDQATSGDVCSASGEC